MLRLMTTTMFQIHVQVFVGCLLATELRSLTHRQKKDPPNMKPLSTFSILAYGIPSPHSPIMVWRLVECFGGVVPGISLRLGRAPKLFTPGGVVPGISTARLGRAPRVGLITTTHAHAPAPANTTDANTIHTKHAHHGYPHTAAAPLPSQQTTHVTTPPLDTTTATNANTTGPHRTGPNQPFWLKPVVVCGMVWTPPCGRLSMLAALLWTPTPTVAATRPTRATTR